MDEKSGKRPAGGQTRTLSTVPSRITGTELENALVAAILGDSALSISVAPWGRSTRRGEAMTDLLDRLYREHRVLARVLDLFDDLLDRFHEGGEPDYELMSEMLEYMETYSDQVHHPSEEDIFDRLRARTNEVYPVLDLLTKQHVQLGQMNKRFRQSLEGIMHEEVLRRDEVEVQGRQLVKTLREHLNLEETDAFPLARERLSVSDWEELGVEAPSEEDPLLGDAGQARFRALFQHLSEQTQD